jgi:glycosyltransferase involved in cell wall biosynthesis
MHGRTALTAEEAHFVAAPLRLLVDCAPLSGGGGAQVASAFLEHLIDEPQVQWIAIISKSMLYALSDRLKRDQRVIIVEKKSWFDRLVIRRLLVRHENMFKPNVVFSVFGPAYFRAKNRHLVGFALPLMIYDYDHLLGQPKVAGKFITWLGRRAFRRTDHIVVETETVRQRLSSRLKIPAHRISVIGNGINPLFSAAISDKQRADSDVFGIIVPSAYYRHKNLEVIPDIAAEMRKLDPDFRFEFRLTLQQDSAAWKNIATAAAKLGIGDCLTTLGVLSLDALAEQYAKASATFLPTLREASTAVYPETFYAERPLVTTDIDFARELCWNAALYVTYSDLETTAATLLRLAKDPILQADLVAAGKHQLATTYPTTAQKYAMQMSLIRTVAGSATSAMDQS